MSLIQLVSHMVNPRIQVRELLLNESHFQEDNRIQWRRVVNMDMVLVETVRTRVDSIKDIPDKKVLRQRIQFIHQNTRTINVV